MAQSIDDVLRHVLKNHQPAIDYILLIRDVAHFWDDLIDKDRHLGDADINAAMFKALVLLPQNSFYLQFKDSLQPILVNAIANWQAANQFEAGNDERLLQVAFIARSDYANLLIHCAYLIGGYAWMNEVTPRIRSLWTEEDFAQYRANLEREQTVKQIGQCAAVQRWYEEETAEYLKHGLTIFSASLLGETEPEHVAALYKLIDPPQGAAFVDMGCGAGGVANLMQQFDAQAKFFCVTNVQAQIDVIRTYGRSIQAVQADYHRTGLPDGVADVVMFNESIGYGNLQHLLKESARLLKAGGVVAIKDALCPDGPLFCESWQYATYSEEIIKTAAAEAGLLVQQSTELPVNLSRYEKFVQDSDLMRARYGRALVPKSTRPWYWRLLKAGD